MATSPLPQQDTVVDVDSEGPHPQQSDGANGTRPENGTHSRRKYRLLAPEDPEGGLSNAGPWVREAGHGATMRTVDDRRSETETGDKTGQSRLLVRGMQEDGNGERRTLTGRAR